MATLKNVIKKAEKLSGEKIKVNTNFTHFLFYKGYEISFHPNGRMSETAEAICFYTKRIGDEDDHQSDYFAGIFHENITQCFDFINRNPYLIPADKNNGVSCSSENVKTFPPLQGVQSE
jgi:hypothetical protein